MTDIAENPLTPDDIASIEAVVFGPQIVSDADWAKVSKRLMASLLNDWRRLHSIMANRDRIEALLAEMRKTTPRKMWSMFGLEP